MLNHIQLIYQLLNSQLFDILLTYVLQHDLKKHTMFASSINVKRKAKF